LEALDIIEDPRGGRAEQWTRQTMRIVSAVEVVDLLLSQVGDETL